MYINWPALAEAGAVRALLLLYSILSCRTTVVGPYTHSHIKRLAAMLLNFILYIARTTYITSNPTDFWPG